MTFLRELRPGTRFRCVYTQQVGTVRSVSPCSVSVDFDQSTKRSFVAHDGDGEAKTVEIAGSRRRLEIAPATEVEVLP